MDAGSVNQDGSFYQDILKYVLHKQIQTLVSQLLEETGDETIVLSASLDSGTVTQFGSERAKAFISKDCNVATDFLDFIRKDPNKDSAGGKLSSKSRDRSKRTQEAIDGTEDIKPSAKVAKFCNVQAKPDVADFSSYGCSNKSSSQYVPQCQSEKSNDISGPTPKLPAEDEFGGMRPQHLAEDKFGSLLPLAKHSAANKIPETLEMNAYTEEEQTSLLNYMEMKNKMINSKGDNATNAKTVPDSEEFGMKDTTNTNIESGLADSDVVPAVNDSVKEMVDGNVVNSDSDGSIQGIDDFPKIIIKTEPCDTDANDSLESTAESVDQSDNVCSDLPQYSRTFVFGNKFTRYVSDSTAESGSHLSNSSGGETDVRSSEEKSNASKEHRGKYKQLPQKFEIVSAQQDSDKQYVTMMQLESILERYVTMAEFRGLKSKPEKHEERSLTSEEKELETIISSQKGPYEAVEAGLCRLFTVEEINAHSATGKKANKSTPAKPKFDTYKFNLLSQLVEKHFQISHKDFIIKTHAVKRKYARMS